MEITDLLKKNWIGYCRVQLKLEGSHFVRTTNGTTWFWDNVNFFTFYQVAVLYQLAIATGVQMAELELQVWIEKRAVVTYSVTV